MAIIFMDGMDHFAIGSITKKWTTTANTALTTGRFGGSAVQFNSSSDTLSKTVSTPNQSWRVGFAMKIASGTWSNFQLLRFRDNIDTQCELTLLSSGKLQFSRNGTLLGSASATTMTATNWYYIEAYVSIKDSISAGNAQCYINGVQELNLAGGTDIKNHSTTNVDTFLFQCASGIEWHLDDFYCSSEADTTTPTFLGDRRIATLYPDGNGNYSQFVGSDGNSTNNYLLVDEASLDEADYVTSDVVDNRDSYTFGNLSQTATAISAVQITTAVKKDDAGTRVGRVFFRIGGSDYESGNLALSTTFNYATYVATTNPATASAWTNSDISALECGVKVHI